MTEWHGQLNANSLDWLLTPDPTNPGVRYFALRDLLDRAVDDIELWMAIGSLFLVLAGVGWHVNQRSEHARRKAIRAKMSEWGAPTCRTILMKKIRIGLTTEQVELSWGEPYTIDQQEVIENGVQKQRWVYGRPQSDEKYVYFTDDMVTKWRA